MIKFKVHRDGKESEVEVGERTFNILRVLEKWGVLGLAQVKGLLFADGLREIERMRFFFNWRFKEEYTGACYKAMKVLEELRLIEAQHYVNMPWLFYLTREGHAVLGRTGFQRIGEIRQPLLDSLVKHEVLVTGIGLTLTELLGLGASTEFERQFLSRGGEQDRGREPFPLPDLWVSDPGQPKAIEVERTLKSMARYRKLWTFYRDNLPGSAVVLYITAFANGPRLLLSRARRLMADFVYVCALEDFQSSLGRCAFVGYRGAEIRLRPRLDHPQAHPHPPAPSPAPEGGPA
ncbi:MAG: hypothetical protein KGJ84_02070 [Elusimicrobia bacterium]|nr:hypothetical protein [Elusimicrobiota bacterium]